MDTKTFEVPNIGCDGCVRTVENELKELVGVSHVKAEADSRMVTIEWGDPATWQQIADTLTEIDYAPAGV